MYHSIPKAQIVTHLKLRAFIFIRLASTFLLMVASPNVLMALNDTFPCERIGELAEATMKQRQRGGSLQDTLHALDSLKPSLSDQNYESLGSILRGAYDEPLQTDNDLKDKAIAEYRNHKQSECVNAPNSAGRSGYLKP
jgi:hypothetical protein